MSASMRIWNFATVLAVIVTIALGWFLGAAPKLAEASISDTERLAVLAQNDLTRTSIAQLEADFQGLAKLRDELAALREQFPSQVEYDDAVEELLTTLLAQGLTLSSLSFAEPTPSAATVVGPEEVAPEVAPLPGEPLSRGSLLAVSVSVTVQGPLSSALSYIDALQRSTRFGLVSSLSHTGGGTGGNPETTFTLTIYVISGEDLVDVEPTDPIEPTPEPSAEPTPESTDPAATEPESSPSPVPTP